MTDLDGIVRIEEACFSAPWTRKMLAAELEGNVFATFLIAKWLDGGGERESVVGYINYWVVFEELRIMNVAVLQAERRRGIACALLRETLRAGVARGANRAVLEVRASNAAALGLYEQMGFKRVSVRARYYKNPEEDAVLMDLSPIR